MPGVDTPIGRGVRPCTLARLSCRGPVPAGVGHGLKSRSPPTPRRGDHGRTSPRGVALLVPVPPAFGRSLAHSLRGPVHSHGYARQRPASRPAGMVWQACRGQSRASPTVGLAKAPSRQPGPEELIPPCPPRGEVVGSPLQASLPRFALLAPVPPAFGRSFAPPPLRSGSAHSLTHSGVPSTRTATRPRSRRGRVSCPRGAGIPARA